MIFSKLKKPIAALALLLMLTACRKDTEEGVKTYLLPQEVYDYLLLPEGTVRVYRDSATGVLDTVRTYRSEINIWTATWGPDPNAVAFHEEKIIQKSLHSFGSHTESIESRVKIRKSGEYFFEISENDPRYGASNLTKIPWQVGDSIADNWLGGKSTVINFYPTITLVGKSYSDVFHIQRSGAGSKNWATLDYYFAKNKGLVVCKNYKTNSVWVLEEN